jgi:UDP-N-acetylmuramyl pentapeptide synthase
MVDTNAQAVEALRALIESGPGDDRVLVKGSRGMAMEEIVSSLTQEQKAVMPKAKDSRL